MANGSDPVSDASTETSGVPARLIRRASATLAFERAWPPLAGALATCALFLAASWAGLWLALPGWARAAGVILFAAAVLGCLASAIRAARISERDALTRLDEDSGLPHRIATGLSETLASPDQDPVTRRLWTAHRRRLKELASRLRVSPPDPRLDAKDAYALRFASVLALAVAAIAAGPEREARLLAAFEWDGRAENAVPPRLDGWINPPLHTRVPPIILDLQTGGAERTLRVPIRSEIVVRTTGSDAIEARGTGGLDRNASAASTGASEHRFTLTGDATLNLRIRRESRTIGFAAIPDMPPSVRLVQPPSTDSKGMLEIVAAFEDDYGVASGEVVVLGPVRDHEGGGGKAPLVPAPMLNLSLGADARGGETRSSFDLREHAWAGAEIEAQLLVLDDAGQEGRSAIFRVTLPGRPFTEPLAKALIEQRRDLVIDPGRRGRILEALHALMIEPARFTPDPAVWLGLRKASRDLRRAKSDVALLEVADWLHAMAIAIEQGSATDAEKALQAAERALREAMDRGASAEELKRLMDQLRDAMDRYMRELAEKMMRDPGRQEAERDRDRSGDRMLTQRDLDAMMNRMERMMRDGRMAEAQQMLDQLRNLMRDLKNARPMRDPMGREMQQALDELDRMTRDQQALRDETFREGQRRRDEQRRNRQQSRQGQPGEQGQQGRQGQQGENGDQQAQDGQGRSLAERQQELRRRLEEMRRRMQGMGGEPEGLGEAEGEMGRAEGAIGRDADGEAVDAQGRALENLRRGAREMARRMQERGNQFGEGEPGGEPGGEARDRADSGDRDRDPLGREVPSREAGDRARLQEGGKKGTLELRAREVLEELRRRLGETARPQGELDYLQRLIDPRR
jgi:uncharacterized protein (TIGR02302 family)